MHKNLKYKHFFKKYICLKYFSCDFNNSILNMANLTTLNLQI